MLRSTKQLHGLRLSARDGDVGRCQAFLFDDEYWMVRSMVVRLGHSALRDVLISPVYVHKLPNDAARIPVHLTRAIVERAPPLSRLVRPQVGLERDAAVGQGTRTQPFASDTLVHLWGTDQITGYRVEAVRDVVGEVRDFVVDDQNWMICYVVARCGKWPKRRDVLISTAWITGIVPSSHRIRTRMPDQMLTDGTPFRRQLLNHPHEVKLYDFYDRPAHWTEKSLEEPPR